MRDGWLGGTTIVEWARDQADAARELGLPAHQRSTAHWLKWWHKLWVRRRREYLSRLLTAAVG